MTQNTDTIRLLLDHGVLTARHAGGDASVLPRLQAIEAELGMSAVEIAHALVALHLRDMGESP